MPPPDDAPPLVFLPEDLTFRPATATDHRFLYELLRERYEKGIANVVGMARGDLPSYAQHVEHLERTPYKQLEIVVADDQDSGMMYLSHDNVGGCFILRRHAARGLALAACYRFFMECELPVIAHINPANRAAYRTVERLGFTRTEDVAERLTFELHQRPIDPFARVRARRRLGGA
ncbi:MAG: hypothetical protein GY711_16675 [bacterium]|nr:hypothetical protein [bacterium]